MTRRVGIGDVGKRLAGGGSAYCDEDLVCGEAEVGIGELGSELAERGREIGVYGGSSGRHCCCLWWRCCLPLGMAQRQVSEEVSHCEERERFGNVDYRDSKMQTRYPPQTIVD